MREAELDVLRARLQGGMLSKARRAALKLHVPIGFCDADDGRMVLDANRQVQDTIRFLWRTFRRTGSASRRSAPSGRPTCRFRAGTQRPHPGEPWATCSNTMGYGSSTTPAAGAFVFGRTWTSKTAEGRTHIAALPREEWQVVVRDAHVGYVTWEAYEAHVAQLAANSQAYTPHRLHPHGRDRPSCKGWYCVAAAGSG